MTDLIGTDLKAVMRRLRFDPPLGTRPERLALAHQQKTPHQDFLFTLLSDECQRRDSAASTTRAQRALLDPEMVLERWDPTAKVTCDEALLAKLVSLRFIEAHRHATIVGPVGVGKTFIAHALGHVACRRGFTVLALRADRLLLKTLKRAPRDRTPRSVDSLSGCRTPRSTDSVAPPRCPVDGRCCPNIGRHHQVAVRAPVHARPDHSAAHAPTALEKSAAAVASRTKADERLATFADPVRAQAAIDRFTSNVTPEPWRCMRTLFMLLGLVRRLGARSVDETCALAIAADMFDVFRFERMLELAVPPAPEPEPARVIQAGRFLRPASDYALPCIEQSIDEGEDS